MPGLLRPSRCVALCLALAGVVILSVFPYLAAVNNPNENVRTYMTMALVEDGTLRIDRMVQRHGWINDMAKAPDPVTKVEHVYSVKGPAISYLGVVPYWTWVKLEGLRGRTPPGVGSPPVEKAAWLRDATFVMRFFTTQIPCFLFLIWFERFLRRFVPDVVFRMTAVVAAGLGTNFLAYAQMFVSHAAFACAAFSAFAVITEERLDHATDARERSWKRAFLAGLLTGLCTVLEYHGLVVSAVLGVYALFTFYRPTRLVAFGIGGAIDVAVLMLFQWRAYGDPFTPGHKMLENASYKAFHVRGLFGIEPPNLEHCVDLLFNPTFGFLGTSPFMWLAVLAVPAVIFYPHGRRETHGAQRLAVTFAIVAMVILVVAVSGAVVWRGGWTIGPRLVGAAPPFFACGAAYGLERISQKNPGARLWLRGIAGGLACASVVQIGFVGLVYNTVPEELVRPLPDFALPYARAGFAPYHLGHVFGVHSATYFRVVLGCLAAAVLLAALWPANDSLLGVAARVLLVAGVAWLGLRPAFSEPRAAEAGDRGVEIRRAFAVTWEPEGANPLLRMRSLAEGKGRTRMCLWGELARLEATMKLEDDAKAHAARAGSTLRCP
ncbi:MAG: hypothetical protein JNL79_11105 [Myxococcales bacterium]|nr:hypothetical protein [Myxococcales bacterium]